MEGSWGEAVWLGITKNGRGMKCEKSLDEQQINWPVIENKVKRKIQFASFSRPKMKLNTCQSL
jgi:hypothetical protein